MKKTSRKSNNECAKCGYKMVHLHSGKCPFCRVCSGCGRKVAQCVCLEGE